MTSRFASPINTSRLALIPATAAHVRAELQGNAEFEVIIAAEVPASWPPGEYDRPAQEYFLKSLEAAGDSGIGWFGWYAVLREHNGVRARVIGCGGYFGPPSGDGVVEIGYSVCPEFQRKGYATEMASALVAHARKFGGASGVIAHTFHDHHASISVLERSGFVQAQVSDQPDTVLFEWRPPAQET